MTKQYLFADEAGCFTFNRAQNVSRYFILCTIITPDLNAGYKLQCLRHRLVWDGAEVGDYFHATADKQVVRDAVYSELQNCNFTVQATICEKSKAQPQVRSSKARFYKYPWYYHFNHGISRQVGTPKSIFVTAASIGSKKERQTFTNALSDVMSQTLGTTPWAVDFRPSQADPSLQIADYCAWAIQRKWEHGDTRAYDLIKTRITYEYELWKNGTVHYY